jgi:RsiW-degrading membrane proteinase PrsW (M82 family)
MTDIREKSGPQALLLGFISFVAFEVVAYYLLRYLTSGLGESNQEQTDHTTIVSNWVKTMAFLVLHLALVIVAVLVLSNRLPRRHRGQLMSWFYSSLVTGFLLLIPLFSE